MNQEMLILLLFLIILLLLCIVLYQQYAFRRGLRRELRDIQESLKTILDQDRKEPLLLFTDSREMQELAAQINRILEELRNQRADFRRLELSSRKMLSNISHDLKTPLTVLSGYLEILRLNAEQGQNLDMEMLKKAEQKAQSISALIGRFFTLARLESGDMELPLSPMDACEICRETLLDFYELLQNDGFETEVKIPETPILIRGNQEALQRILSNLISNAIRYGADGHYLCLSLHTEGSSVFIRVADKGKGIDKAFSDQIFDRLFTLEDSRNRRIQGSGLGLSIARQLALKLGGSLTLESVPFERTVFTLELPISEEQIRP